ncbi:BrnA antitoxin family protein [Allohahella marinimesophila]|uniref:BrnA antitoxin family protein n=1 Tax=Allohahella marinimesophila TaxID=1054972 RepID=A0ABP7NSC3_9GAMM
MKPRKPLIDEDGEVREITAEDMKHFRPAHEVLPDGMKTVLGVRGAQKSPTKERITIRLSPEVLAHFRSTGKGWQGRIDSVLEEWVRSH